MIIHLYKRQHTQLRSQSIDRRFVYLFWFINFVSWTAVYFHSNHLIWQYTHTKLPGVLNLKIHSSRLRVLKSPNSLLTFFLSQKVRANTLRKSGNISKVRTFSVLEQNWTLLTLDSKCLELFSTWCESYWIFRGLNYWSKFGCCFFRCAF